MAPSAKALPTRIAMVVDPQDRAGRIFDCRFEAGNRDLQREPLRDVRDRLADLGIELSTLDRRGDLSRADLVVFHVFDRALLGECLRLGIGERTVLLAWEPPVVQPRHSLDGLRRLSRLFGRILTWDDSLVDGDAFLSMRYPHALAAADPSPLPFEGRGLLVNMSGNKNSSHPLELYSARARAIRHFEATEPDFELWGPGWDAACHPSWKGLAPSKRDVYHRFRFALCFENMRDVRGYSTEKLFDCLQWGIVPVYLGDPALAEILPPESFVDYRALGTPEALRSHLCSWTRERHEAALEAGRLFLSSDAARPWSGSALAEQLARCVDLAGIRPRRPRPSPGDVLELLSAGILARARELAAETRARLPGRGRA
jgi:hypothetical protein